MSDIKPWSVQLEVTEGCNFRCWFCGIHSIRTKEYKWNHMSPEGIVRPAAQEINEWLGKPRFELNNHGEPTLNPEYLDIVQILREEVPRCHIQTQTNGYTMFPQLQEGNDFKAHVREFFDRGGNLLAINCYKKGFYEYAMENCQDMLGTDPGLFRLVDFYYDNPNNLSAYCNYGPRSKKVFVFQDLGLINVNRLSNKRMAKKILNEAGNSPEKPLEKKLGIEPIREPLKKGCSRVYRELTIGWNGEIPTCCYDWKSDLVFGKFPEKSLREIWYGPYWKAARVLLHPSNAERNMKPCNVCDYKGGFRLGLLPKPDSDMSVAEAYDTLWGAEVDYGSYRKSLPILG